MARSISGGFREEKPKPKPLPLRDRIDPTLRQFEQLEMLQAELEREYAAVPARMDADEYFHSLGIIEAQREALGRKQARLAGIPTLAKSKPEKETIRQVAHHGRDWFATLNTKGSLILFIVLCFIASKVLTG